MLLLSLTACGNDHSTNYNNNGVLLGPAPVDSQYVLWSGFPEDDPNLLTVYSEVKQCMSQYSFSRLDAPMVKIYSHPFRYSDTESSYGYFYNDIIYLAIPPDGYSFIYIANIKVYDRDAKHELVHWFSSNRISDHESSYMKQCTSL